MLNLRHLEVFHAIMCTGSVTAAARLLNVSQPSVSTVLQHAESRLRITLFTRSGGRLRPTPEAQALWPAVEAIFGRVSALERQIQDLGGGRLGTLSLAAAVPIANGYLAKAVAEFTQSRPGLQVTLQSLTSAQVVESVLNGEAEIGVVHSPVSSAGMDIEVLAHSPLACVMPRRHPLARHKEIGMALLADYPVITYLPQSAFRNYVNRAFDEVGVTPSVNIQVGLSLTGLVLAYHGAGVAIVEPSLLVSLPMRSGLVARPLAPRIALKTLIVRASAAPRSVIAEAFLVELRATLRATQRVLEKTYGTP
ncbi:MAG: LysR family transcriptional regulator [Pusillimonas sp.]